MNLWSFVIGPASGGLTRELSEASGRTVNFRLQSPSDASCSLDGSDPAASEIVELSTDLHVYRSNSPGQPRQHWYRGRIGKTSDSLDANGHTVEVPSADYRELLKRRLLMSGSTQTWTAQDQGSIAWNLLTQTQNKPGGDLGITNGLGQTTGQLRTRTYNLADPIGDKIQELSELINGFDWDITGSETGLQLDRWYPQRGSDKGEILQYGGNIASLTRTVDSSTFANAVRLTGKQPDGGGAEPAVQERTASDITTRVEGRWDVLYQEDITTTTALSERADWRIADSQVIQPSYSVKLEPDWWRGPDHIWLGDTVRLIIYSGRLTVDVTLRVLEIQVSISDDDDEDVTLTLGSARKDFKTKLNGIDARLARLERR